MKYTGYWNERFKCSITHDGGKTWVNKTLTRKEITEKYPIPDYYICNGYPELLIVKKGTV